MTLLRTDVLPLPYSPRPATAPLPDNYIQDELNRLQQVVSVLSSLVCQPASRPPANPRRAMIRFCVAPWDPLGTGEETFVGFNGTTWLKLTP